MLNWDCTTPLRCCTKRSLYLSDVLASKTTQRTNWEEAQATIFLKSAAIHKAIRGFQKAPEGLHCRWQPSEENNVWAKHNSSLTVECWCLEADLDTRHPDPLSTFSTLILNTFSNFQTHVSLRATMALWDQSSQVTFIFPMRAFPTSAL